MDPYPPVHSPVDVYAPPKAAIQMPSSPAGGGALYVVAPFKFALLFLATIGIYQVYWFYRNWKLLKEQTGENIWPVARAIFSIFFAHQLFRRVDAKIASMGQTFPWSPSTTGTLYVGLAIISNILDRAAGKSLGSPWTDIASVVILPLLVLVLDRAQRAINLAGGDPEGASNSTLTVANFVWLAIGLLIWVLMLAGVLMEFGLLPQ